MKYDFDWPSGFWGEDVKRVRTTEAYLSYKVTSELKRHLFLEITVVYEIKVYRWSKQNEYMRLYEYQSPMSCIDLVPSHSDLLLLFLNNGYVDWSQISYGASLG